MMKPLPMFGVALNVLGLAVVAYQGISYTKPENVLDIGPLHATTERARPSRCPP